MSKGQKPKEKKKKIKRKYGFKALINKNFKISKKYKKIHSIKKELYVYYLYR